MTSREARHASEMRRRARRRAEARGAPPPAWATPRDGTDPEPPPRDRAADVLRLSGTARAALALARQASAAATRATELEDTPASRTEAAPVLEVGRPWTPDPAWTPDPRADALAYRSIARGADALERVLSVPCPVHDVPAGHPCWHLEGHRAACAERIARARPGASSRRATSSRATSEVAR